MYTGRRARAYSRPHVSVVKHGNELADSSPVLRVLLLFLRRREDGEMHGMHFKLTTGDCVHNTHSQSELSVQSVPLSLLLVFVLTLVATTRKLSERFYRTDPTEQPTKRATEQRFAPGLYRATDATCKHAPSRVHIREHSPAGKTRGTSISLHLQP